MHGKQEQTCGKRRGTVRKTTLRAVAALSLVTGLSGAAFAQSVPAMSPELMAKVNGGQYAAAEAGVRALLLSDPGYPRANFLLGYLLFRERRYSDSLAAYTQGAKGETPSPDDLVVVASDYIQLRSYTDAVRWLTYATEHAPGNVTAWYLLGRSHFLLDHPAEALAAFEHCLRLRPNDLPAKYNSGLALERLQRPADAEAAYRQAMEWASEQHSNDPQPWLDFGNLLLTGGRAAEAVAALKAAAEKAPANPLCQQQLGVAFAATGNQDSAVAALRRALALAPKAERAHFYLARSLKALGRKAESDAEFATVDRLLNSHQAEETPNFDVAPPMGGENPKKTD